MITKHQDHRGFLLAGKILRQLLESGICLLDQCQVFLRCFSIRGFFSFITVQTDVREKIGIFFAVSSMILAW